MKFDRLDSKTMKKVVDKLRRADKKRKCHICKKLGPDGFWSTVVSVHIKCVENINRALLR